MDWGGGVKGHVVNVFDELEVRVQRLVPGDVLAGMGRHASHQRCYVGFGGPPGLVVWLILTDSVEKHLPFGLVGVAVGQAVLPNQLFGDHVVALVDTWFGGTQTGHDDG